MRSLRQRWRQGRIRVAKLLLREAFRLVAIRVYEPVEIAGRRRHHSRDTDERWADISRTLVSKGAKSVLDIGCAEGWLVRRAAQDLGCFAIGVEASDRVLTAEIARLHDDVERAAVMRVRLTPPDICNLPRADAVFCLSVLHHIIRRDGLQKAEDFVRALVGRAAKVVIFEMGTADEAGLAWSHNLPAMPEGQDEFVTDLLQRCGLVNVVRIGSSAAFHGRAERHLFCGEPAKC